ncbi:MAG: hypothetical protein IPM39_19730 [Chloroflexi bacterium]|nr:hypothetical protein [Chloroflexota bacterium]
MPNDSPFHLMPLLQPQKEGPTRVNPPGLTALTYRAGSYSDFVTRMLQRLREQPVGDSHGDVQYPLRHLNLLAGEDMTLALIRAWAIVADIIAFYQERIINEGYLRTATERRSVLELTRAIGYELAPPLAATTYLAFYALNNPDAPGPLRIPAGTAVQSVPAPFSPHEAVKAIVQGTTGADPTANLPIIFETTGDLRARPEWNELKPSRFVGAPWPAAQPGQERTLRLNGLQTGLKPGDGLLIISGSAASSQNLAAWELLLLDGVSPNPTAGYTAVTWQQSHGPTPAEGIPAPQAFALRRQSALYAYAAGSVFCANDGAWLPANIGLPAKPVRAAANGRGRAYVAVETTLYSSRDLGDTWQPLTTGLPPKEIYAVAASAAGAVAIGSDDGSVFLSQDGGAGWTPLSGPGEVEILTGWRRFFQPVRHKLPKTIVRALWHTDDKGPSLLAGTDKGVFAYVTEANRWTPLNGRFPNLDRETGEAALSVRALTAVANGKRLLAGTSSGVFPVEPLFRPPDNKLLLAFLAFVLLLPAVVARLLQSATAVLTGPLTQFALLVTLLVLLYLLQPRRLTALSGLIALAFYATQSEWVVSDQIIFLLQNLLAQAGSAVDGALLINPLLLLLLALLGANLLFAALGQLPGLMRRAFPFLQAKSTQPSVYDLLPVGDSVYAATDQGIFRLTAVPGWRVRWAAWLRRLFRGPEPETWTAVSLWPISDSPADEQASRTVYALALDENGRLMAGTASGDIYLRLGDDWRREADLPLASVRAILNTGNGRLAAGQPVEVVGEKRWTRAQLRAGAIDLPLQPANAPPGSYAVALDAESAALLTLTGAANLSSHDVRQGGQITRVTVKETADLPNFQRGQTRFYYQSEPLPLYDDCFLPQPVGGDRLHLQQENLGLQSGQRLALVGLPVGQTDHLSSELLAIQSVAAGDGRTLLTLAAPLRHNYQRDSVTLYGNLAPAIHGETIYHEPLGDSDGTQANQRFWLRRPLAFVAAPSGDYETTLTVMVSGIPWRKTPSLLGQPPDARVYMVRRSDSGATAVIFGDGQQGARLPTSQERLSASYRSGGGPAGNVPRHSLMLLPSQLPLISKVSNPLPASGGEPAESMDQGRYLAPRRLQANQRIVSYNDFLHFASSYPGVGKAAARQAGPRRGAPLEIAIAPRHPRHLEQDDKLLTDLAAAVAHVRSRPQPPVAITPYQLVHFQLDVTCHLDLPWRHLPQAEWDELQETIRRLLATAFAFEKRQIGQMVTEAELYGLLQGVRGITAVTLHHLHRVTPNPNPQTRPDEPTRDILAAWDELLLPDPQALTIRLELARGM